MFHSKLIQKIYNTPRVEIKSNQRRQSHNNWCIFRLHSTISIHLAYLYDIHVSWYWYFSIELLTSLCLAMENWRYYSLLLMVVNQFDTLSLISKAPAASLCQCIILTRYLLVFLSTILTRFLFVYPTDEVFICIECKKRMHTYVYLCVLARNACILI